ncbi:hypothetical protein [Bdellovibrio sp. HCB209]|uniref:hypothetical protein n=1 Tax=Bdellovibrio sp. HCB209 TaxID=3394354 RepID=UPI0039B3DF48
MSGYIGDFTDYRDFLNFKYKEAKAKKASFSLQYCATQLQVSKTFVKFVFDKKRHFTFPTLPLVWELFRLTPKERMQLTFLFCFTVSEDPTLKSHFKGVLDGIHNDVITVE